MTFALKTRYLGDGFKNPLTKAHFFVFIFVVAALQDLKMRFLRNGRYWKFRKNQNHLFNLMIKMYFFKSNKT